MTKETSNAMNTADKMDRVATALNRELTFNFKSAGVSKTISIDMLPVETLAILLDYGTRKLNDKVNSLYADNPEPGRQAYVERVLQEAMDGKLGERRQAVSGNAGLRNYILTFIKNQGVPAKNLADLKSATPERIVKEVWKNKSPEQQGAILAELTKRYEDSLKAVDILEVDF